MLNKCCQTSVCCNCCISKITFSLVFTLGITCMIALSQQQNVNMLKLPPFIKVCKHVKMLLQIGV